MTPQLPTGPRPREFPPYGLVRTRMDFDDILVRHAVKHGARLLEATNVTGPVLDDARRESSASGRAPCDENGRSAGPPLTYRAPLVVAADGNSSRLSLSMGRPEARRPADGRRGAHLLHVARATTTTTSSPGSSSGSTTRRTPASASSSPATAGSSASATAPPTWASGSSTPPRRSATSTTRTSCGAGSRRCREEWTYNDETMVGPIRGAALPMGFNRQPHYADGLLLVGDAGGMVNPFNGEGIAYAMESGRLAAEVVAQAFARPTTPAVNGSFRHTPRHEGCPRRLLHPGPLVRPTPSAIPR